MAAAILPDIPLEESGPWCEAADGAGVETVMVLRPGPSSLQSFDDDLLIRIQSLRDRNHLAILGAENDIPPHNPVLGVHGQHAADVPDRGGFCGHAVDAVAEHGDVDVTADRGGAGDARAGRACG